MNTILRATVSVGAIAALVCAALIPAAAASASTDDGTDACVARTESRTTDGGYIEYRVVASCSTMTPNAIARGVLPLNHELDLRTEWFSSTGIEVASDWYSPFSGTPGTPRVEVVSGVDHAPAGAVCEQEERRNDGAGSFDEFSLRCSAMPIGVQVRAVAVRTGWEDTVTEWSAQTDTWFTLKVNGQSHFRVDFRANPAGVGSDCKAEIVKTIDRPFEYDQHAVRASCTVIAPAVQVRGKAAFTGQTDVHTEWFTTTGTNYQSPGQTRTVPAMPYASVEYELRPY